MTVSRSGHDLRPMDARQREALAGKLTPEQRRIILHQGTEPPFCGTLLDNEQAGMYACRLCSLPLFESNAKFASNTGWPSFDRPFDPQHIKELLDESHNMVRIEVRCRRCDGHLGHVFDDGPPPSGRRYCLNSQSLKFYPERP